MRRMFMFVILVCCIISCTVMETYGQKKTRKVAILIYDSVYMLDFSGPLEVFNDTMLDDTTQAFDVFLVAPTRDMITSNTNTQIIPTFPMDNCPQPDILVIPGGNLDLAKSDAKVADWIRKVNETTEVTMSVCTGAFILADLGMLDGMEATTWHGAAKQLQSAYPKIKVRPGKRYTDNGKIVTTAGVSAGIDGSLYLVARLLGKETARATAKYIEYDYYK